MRAIIAAAALIPFLFACKTNDRNETHLKDLNTTWEKSWSCENGSVVIDVNTMERRELQLVVRNPALFGYLDENIPYSQVRTAGERIYSGRASAGVFAPEQLLNFYRYEVVSTQGSRPGIEVRRHGDTIVLRQLDFTRTQCDSQVRHNDYSACEVANFVFRGCRQH